MHSYPLALYSGATGEFGSCCTGVQAWIFVALQVMLLLPFCFKDAGGAVEGGWLDLPRSSLGGGGPSMASSDPGAGWVEARPRSMGDRRWLHPAVRDGCLFRLLSKPVGDGILPAQGDARRLLRWRRPATRTTSAFGLLWIQGLQCNFYFLSGP